VHLAPGEKVGGRIARLPRGRGAARDYVRKMGFTPRRVSAGIGARFYPFVGLPGDRIYSPTSRFGTPDDFQYLVNALHEAGIGVIVTGCRRTFRATTGRWRVLDGTALYEHEDPRKGRIGLGDAHINFGPANEVNNFLTPTRCSGRPLHLDGLRVDAVASMLYLDTRERGRMDSQSIRAGVEILKRSNFCASINYLVHTAYPGVVHGRRGIHGVAAGDASAVSRRLGFSFKWNMGWMQDTLNLFPARSDLSQIPPE